MGTQLTTTQENFIKALDWHPQFEDAKRERITEISFGPHGNHQKSFVSKRNAQAFREKLESLDIEYREHVYDFADYGRIR